MKLKIMTFNTQHCKNFITKKIDYENVINMIKKYNPDIIGLNEIYGKGYDRNIQASQADEIARDLGYYSYFGKATRLLFKPYGNAILSKYPILNAGIIKIPYPIIRKGTNYYERRSIIKANININNETITIFVTHLGLNKDEQQNGIKTLLENIDNKNTIIMGDFNVSPDNILLKQVKDITTDAASKFSTELFSFPSNNPHIKYDYIFTSKDINIISADIPNEMVSDHRPHIAQIEIKRTNNS